MTHGLCKISSLNAASPLSYTNYSSTSPSTTFSPSASSGLNITYRQGTQLSEFGAVSRIRKFSLNLAPGKGRRRCPFQCYLPRLRLQVVSPAPGPSSCGTLYSPALMSCGLPFSSALSGRTDISILSPSSLHSHRSCVERTCNFPPISH